MPREPQPGWSSERFSQGYVADYKPFVFVDGEGVRCSLYVSGCLFACEGCFNEATWSFRYGSAYTDELEDRILADLAHESVQGLSLLGGEPFLNTGVCLRLVRRVRERFAATVRDRWWPRSETSSSRRCLPAPARGLGGGCGVGAYAIVANASCEGELAFIPTG